MFFPVYLSTREDFFPLPCLEKSSSGEIGKKEFYQRKLKKLCSQFEAIFLDRLLKHMRNTLFEEDVNDFTQKIYKEQFYSLLARELAERGGIGLAEYIYSQLKNKI